MANENTVIGVFDEYRTAENVAQELVSSGIPRQSIDVQSNFKTGAAGRVAEDTDSHEGGISGFFHRLFGGDDSDSNHEHYAEAVRRGSAVVCVTGTPDQTERAVQIMNGAGAIDIDRRVERYRETGYERHDPKSPAYSHEEARAERERFRNNEQGASIPVIEEELQVGKRAVQRGGVRVYSHTVEEQVEQPVELREEHVRVERRPADRPVESGDRLRDQTIEMTEMAEEPVVQKRARVREEVVVGKETTQRTEQVRENVKHTVVDVEQLGKGQDYAADFRKDWQTRYAGSGETFETYEPAYNYGYRSASDPRYQGRNWSDVEEDLRTDYLRSNPNSKWDQAKGAVRYGWEKVTRKR
jgi:uncharacterized protein (TIGR02271 family)